MTNNNYHKEQAMSNANNVSNTASVGTIVEYEDRANAPRRFVVVGLPGEWGQFVLRNMDADSGYAYDTSDLRQAGWKMVSA